MSFLGNLFNLLSCFFILLPLTQSSECKYGDYNFSPLTSFEWDVRWNNGSANFTYKINICDTINDDECGSQSSVCRYANTNQVKNIGTRVETLNITEHDKELRLHLTGDQCESNPNNQSKAVINFKCGRSLGSPVVVDANACETFFEWSTHLACKRTYEAKEVKCYVYDHDGHKRDLTPLIKSSGSYLVESQDQREFYINVCRELADAGDLGCAQETAACIKYNNPAHVEDYGKPINGLNITADNQLYLTYTTDTKPSECEDYPMTTITFKCPQRGMAHGPLLISDLQCHYQIEWRTEYACPEKTLIEKNSCKLTMDNHGVEIDLTPLKRSRMGHDVMWNSSDTSKTYKYYLNICNEDKEDGMLCPDVDNAENVAACQRKDSEAEFGKVIGKMDKQILRYSDRNLTLIYEGGDSCSDNFHRRTVINFYCNENAGGLNGEGWPYFNSEEGCTYLFDWETKYACVEHPLSATCSVQSGTKNFDLTSLIKTKGGNWEAESGHHDEKDKSDERYFINLCHNIVRSEVTNNCPEDAAVCRVNGNEAKSMGTFVENPTYETDGSIRLHYKNGFQNSETIITFKCKPGDLESAPYLVRISSDQSTYEFEWHTAAACVQATMVGTQCSVFDDELGIDFDLTSLKKQGDSGDSAHYKVPSGEYMYYINVCDKVRDSPCGDSAAVCQGKTDDSDFNKNAGEPNSKLTYYDGMINLTYTDGDSYSDNKRSRKSQITFLCQRDAGHGQPEFVEERDGTYFFKWMTVLACPEAPVECLVYDHDNNKQYDLSSLTRGKDEANWNALNDNNGPRQKFYINMCRTLNPVNIGSGSCDLDAAVCMAKFENNEEVVDVPNLGTLTSESRPSVQDDGILVQYSNGQSCDNGKKAKTKIFLKCVQGALSTSPTYLNTVDNCEYVFEWSTEAACPLNSQPLTPTVTVSPEEPCQKEDPNSEYVFNLLPLKKKNGQYEVSGDNGKTFKLNICGKVENCPDTDGDDSAICESDTPLGRLNTQLSISDGGLLTLTYSGTNERKAKLTFKCNKRMEDEETLAKVTFVRQDESDYLFDVDTPLACKPEPVDCVVTDSVGNEYDLSPLAKREGNWNVMETAPGRTNLQYFINVCRPINVGTGAEAKCPGGPVGGCQVIADGASHNMGYVQSEPVARNDGSLSIRYVGGSKCHEGNEHKSHRSTRIIFFCSSVQEDPVFLEETPECEYVFNWRTPSACPQKRITGSNCMVTEPLYNYQFNMNTLRKGGSEDYSVEVGEYSYLLNVCGALNSDNCGESKTGESEVGACQTKSTEPDYKVVAGKYNDVLLYEDGLLSLVYTGGKGDCHKQYERKTIINFRCDVSTYGTRGPTFVKEDDECVYIFDWATHWACMPFQVADCGIRKEDGKQYELSSLTLTGGNYIVESQDSENTNQYIINVCTTLVHGEGQACPMNAAACRRFNNGSYELLGKLPLENEPNLLSFDERGNLMLTYNHGKNCNDGREWKTVIVFTCNKDAIDTQPQYLYEDSASCKILFTWETSAACAINEQTDTESDCTVKNALTGYEFDIKSLMAQDKYTVDDKRGHKFDINVCSPVEGSPCDGSSGSCQYDSDNHQWNAGNSNSKLHYEDGLIWANYTGGDKCHDEKYERNTIINFVCGKSGTGNGHPVFVDETDDCTYYFSWHTELACEEKVDCTAIDEKGNVLDLSPLIKGDGHHLAIATSKDSDDSEATRYYINICRPLNPIDSTLCPPMSSACKVTPNKDPMSIGRLSKRPTYDKTSGKVTLIYDRGEKCPSNKQKNATSRIVFSCKEGPSQGTPLLEEITDDCEYIFSWTTNVICSENGPQKSSNCQFKDPRTQYTYDLSPLTKSDGYVVQHESEGVKYYVNPCGPVTATDAPAEDCKNSAVCQVNKNSQGTSFGSVNNETFIMEGKSLKVGYSNGVSCSASVTGKTAAYFLFECGNDVRDNGKPEFFSRSSCDVVFKWRTPLACPPVTTECTFVNKDGQTYDLHVLSRSTGAWNFKDADGNEYWLNLCQSVHASEDGSKCSKEAAACWKKDGQVQMLGTVQSQTMSYENKQLIVKYSGGDIGACAVRKRRSDRSSADVNIYFTCGNSIGRPEILPKKGDSCSFDFKWVSSVACVVKRVPVLEYNGVITDPETLGIIDLNELDGDHEVQSGSNIYKINLKGQMKDVGNQCHDSVVCQTMPVNDIKSLAGVTTVRYYVADDILEATYESSAICDKDKSKKVSTIITFHCSAMQSPPSLTYTSAHCHYLFDWYTPVACVAPDKLGPVAVPVDGDDAATSSSHNHTAGIVIGVLISIIVIIVLLVILLNKDRRTWCAYRARSLCRKSTPFKRMSYSQLSSSVDAENSLLGGGERASLPSFHDDSDEDLIL